MDGVVLNPGSGGQEVQTTRLQSGNPPKSVRRTTRVGTRGVVQEI